jgi:hypothetical protein
LKRDRALKAAREILDRVVCECGHLETDHVPVNHKYLGECADCDCKRFAPVRFRVERAS